MKRLFSSLAAAAAFWTAACSGGGASSPPPPPVGKFSKADLNGQYVYVTNGEVFTGGIIPTPLARTGSFAADGKGNIIAGVEDVNSAGTVTSAIAITGGNYTVNADGRGTLTLVTGQASISFGITLTTANDGLLIDETSTSSQSSTGSGNFIKQSGGPFTVSSVAGPYVFDFTGLDGNQVIQGSESFVGLFTASNGTLSATFGDDNDSGTLTSGSFAGSLAADSLNPSTMPDFGRGVAQIAGLNYVFYVVDSSRVRFLSINGGTMLVGDAVTQTNNIPASVASLNSGFVFVVAGSSANGGITRLGRFTATGATVSNVLVDTNNAGQFTQTTGATNASITLDAANPGRGTVTFLGNGLGTPFSFVFYLNSATKGVIQETTHSGTNVTADIADGTLAGQTGSPFTSSSIAGTYALNWSGLSIQQGGSFPTQDEEDLVGQATVSNLTLKGAADIFQFTNGFPQPDNTVGGSMVIKGDGTGSDGNRNTMSVTLTKNAATATVNFVVYFVNPQLAFFANTSTSNTRIVAGILKAQP
jgi:hypothetical protein